MARDPDDIDPYGIDDDEDGPEQEGHEATEEDERFQQARPDEGPAGVPARDALEVTDLELRPLVPERGGHRRDGAGLVERTEAHTVRILKGLRLGLSYKHAAQYAGISADTLRRWRRDDPDFNEKCDMAEGVAVAHWMWDIEKAAKSGDWRAAAWKLQRRHPSEYGRTISEVSGVGGGPVQIQEVVVRVPEPTPGVDDGVGPADDIDP